MVFTEFLKKWATIILFLSILAGTQRPLVAAAQAEVATGAVAGAATAVTVGSVLEKAREAGQNLIDGAVTQTDSMFVRRANELNLLVYAASRAFEKSLNTPLEKLDDQSRRFINAIDEMARDAKNIVPQVTYLKDTTVVDLRAILAPHGLADEFWVQLITGVTQLENDDKQDYRFSILGTGFGPDSETSQSTFDLDLKGKRVPFTTESVRAGETTFVIPHDVLSPNFDQKKLAVVKANVQVHRKIYSGFWLWKSWHNKSYTVTIHLALVPLYAGTLHVVTYAPVRGWTAAGPITNSATSPNRHCESNCRGEPTKGPFDINVTCGPMAHNPPIEGDCRLVSPIWTNVAGACMFWEFYTWATENNQTSITGKAATWGKPCTAVVSAQKEFYRITGERKVEQDVPVRWGSTVEIAVPVDYTWGRITGMLSTRQQVDVLLKANDSTGYLKYQADTGPTEPRRLLYHLNVPDTAPAVAQR